MGVNYKYSKIDEDEFLTLFSPDGTVTCVTPDTHANFGDLVEMAATGDEGVYESADIGRAMQRKFDDVVDGRVAIRDGIVYFDDDPMDNALTKAIVNFHEQDEDFGPLVRFFENVMANPQPESREQFYRWVEHHDFPIDTDGNIVAYKSVQSTGSGDYLSISSGTAYVNGVKQTGRIRQGLGDVVTMPRSEVQHDPTVACHVGLHAGTYDYANSFSGDTLMFVVINPRDVVSVPHDCTSQKVRVCRYEVLDFAESEYTDARFRTDESAPLDEEDEWEYDSDMDDEYDYWDDEPEDEPEDERPFSGTSEKFRVGDHVTLAPGHLADRLIIGLGGDGLRSAYISQCTGTYEVISMPYDLQDRAFFVDFDGTARAFWDSEGTLVEDEVVSSTVDTRLNHLTQKRGPDGRFIKKP